MKRTRMKVDVLVFEGCPHTDAALSLAKKVVGRLMPEAPVRRVEIDTPEKAAEIGFLGSPSVRINGGKGHRWTVVVRLQIEKIASTNRLHVSIVEARIRPPAMGQVHAIFGDYLGLVEIVNLSERTAVYVDGIRQKNVL